MKNENQAIKKLNLQKPSGTIDFLPEDMEKRRWLTRKIEDSFAKFGIQQIDIPMYDFFDLYRIRSGEKIINDIFTFHDPPKHRATENPPLYALRPEFTAPFVRFYITSELMYRPKPQKYFYIGPCFRYDEPTRGRYRQFTQAGFEVFGADTPAADAEMLIVAMNLMKELQIQEYLLRINDLTFLRTFLQEQNLSMAMQNKVFGVIDNIASYLRKLEIGALEDRTQEDLIGDYYAMMNDLEIDRDLTVILENLLLLVGTASEVIEQLKTIFTDFPATLEAINKSNIPEVCTLLEAANINNYVVDCGIARGLDYYTNTVFEIDVPALGNEKQVCGGGRYNAMVEEFGGESTPGLGFSFGFERLIITLEEQGLFNPKENRSDLLIGTKPETRAYGITIAQQLRAAGLSVETDIMNRSFKATGKFVNRMKIPFMMFLGPREMENKKFSLKNFTTQNQLNDLDLEAVIKEIETFKKTQ
ncbi:Histidine--tRNA ligase [Candidatus Lokiarchaeum ossiferum]|uniref:Histidine--tRNA ligase n=1 Tax=Candidatus Lokiarchaeum ossiferum TaxID=2951803 RepID=A0ABY6HNC5_9ARCH|nr:Histidine--tRNA ligase [Candidatus Lokiarchaeum sp. B-35]